MPTWIIVVGLFTKLILVSLVGLSIWSVAVMLDRRRLFDSKKTIFEARDQLEKNFRALEWQQVATWCELQKETGSSALSRLLVRGLTHGSKQRSKLELAMRAELVSEKAKLEHGLTVLATLGANAPFIGLFGTVLGIIQAFGVLGLSNSGTQSVMSGISEALVATAIGLFVAIPAVVAYNVFGKKLKLVMTELEVIRDLFLSYYTQD